MPKGKVLSSLIYKFSERLMVKGLGLIISIVLARLLSPTEFGQIALIMVFINLSIVIIDSGLSTALVQDKHTSSEDYSTVLYISLSIASFLIVLLWLTAPLIGNYYDDSTIVLPLRVYSFSLLIGACNSILVAKMQREMRFKQMMWCNLVACILSGSVGVIMAYAGYGIWALIAYYFSSSLITCILLLFITKWHPVLTFSIQRAKTLFSFGWKMLVSGFLCSLYYDIRALIIGKLYTPADLGYYNRGQQIPDVVSHTIDNAIQSVMFPVMAQSQDNKSIIRDMLLRTISMGALLMMPIMFGLAAIAEPLVSLLLTDKWLPSVVYMQLICMANVTVSLSSPNLVAIKSIGRSDVYMKLEVVRRVVMIVVLAISVLCFDSVMAIAIGYVFSLWLDYVIIAIPIKRLVGLSFKHQLGCIYKIMIASLLMATIIIMIGKLDLQPWLLLCIQIPTGMCVYVMFCYLLRIDGFHKLLNKLKAL